MAVKNILIIDDSLPEQFLCQEDLLEFDPDFNVQAVYGGAEALELLARNDTKLDLILLDINMPQMNGFEFLERYDADIDHDVPVYMLLGAPLSPADEVRSRNFRSLKGFLNKPARQDEIKDMIDKLSG